MPSAKLIRVLLAVLPLLLPTLAAAHAGKRIHANRPQRARRMPKRPATVRTIARIFEADLSAPVIAAGRAGNPREISQRVAMGRALWRELVVGFASQLGDERLGGRHRGPGPGRGSGA